MVGVTAATYRSTRGACVARHPYPRWVTTSALQTGATVGPYRIVRPLGEGAMGIVFEATREGDGETVALKVLRPELSTDAIYRQRFVHEARAAS